MTLTFITLLYKLRKFHYYEFVKNRKALVGIFLSNIVLYLFLFDHAFHVISSNTINDYVLPLFYLGFFKFYIIIILVHLKPSKDPLEGISKLDLLILVSIN